LENLQKQTQIEELERQLADLKARMPAHSIPPSMMIEVDELEEQLAQVHLNVIPVIHCSSSNSSRVEYNILNVLWNCSTR
jgi:hypothetical protein